MFSCARMGSPAATLPTTGTSTTSPSPTGESSRRLIRGKRPAGERPPSMTLSARLFSSPRRRYPFRSSALRWSLTPLVDRIPKCSPISRMVGGYPWSWMLFLMKARIFSCRSVRGSVMVPTVLNAWTTGQVFSRSSGGEAVYAHGAVVRVGGEIEELLARRKRQCAAVDDSCQASVETGRRDQREVRDLQ